MSRRMLLQQRLPVGPRDAWRGKTKENPEQSGGFSSLGECCIAAFAGHSANAAWINGRKTNEYGKDQRTGRKAGVHL